MSAPVTVRIIDREYTLACEPHERDGLLEAARLLDIRMRDIRAANRMAGIDRIAVLAALNLAHEVLQTRQSEDGEQRDIALTLDAVSRKLDRLLAVVGR